MRAAMSLRSARYGHNGLPQLACPVSRFKPGRARARTRGGTVTSGGPRRGRRDNGLVAAAYAAAGDVDPRVGEHLLDVLALRGIAAYLQPASDLHPVTRTTTLPSRPTDPLFVDREHVETARGFVAQLADESPVPGEPDYDREFAGIGAAFGTRVESGT